MKMVKVGGKSVPFFAADGKGVNDLKKAMYGMKMKRAAYGAKVEMGHGGKMYEMMSGGLVKQYDEGGEVNGDPTGKFFIAAGRDNRGDDPSGREIAAIFMRTPEGPKQIDPKDLLDMFPEADGNIIKAYQMAGIPAKRSGEGVVFPEISDDGTTEGRRLRLKHDRSLMKEFGVENMDDFRDKLGIGPVEFERKRDMPKLAPGYDESLEFI